MNLDFLEIGTCDFETVIQTCSRGAIGLCVEPIKYYLDRLPDRPNVIKVNCAITEVDGEVEMYTIPPLVADTFQWWVKGCSKVGKPHHAVINYLRRIGRDPDKIIEKVKVPSLSIGKLLKRYDVKSIKFLKTDTEGYDIPILNYYLDYCEKEPKLYAKKILFESTKKETKELRSLMERLKEKGYRIVKRDFNTLVVRN